jgi:putative serine protease PepD
VSLYLPALYRQVVPAVVAVRVGRRGGEGGGSGFVVDDRGHVVTNHHVVVGASRVALHLLDGTPFSAEAVATDAANDQAVLRADIPAGALAVARLGDSDTVEPALAIGSPFGFEHSITAGIVSAVDRRAGGQAGRRAAADQGADPNRRRGQSGELRRAAPECVR